MVQSLPVCRILSCFQASYPTHTEYLLPVQTHFNTAWLQIVHMEDIPARQPQYALPSHPLSEPVQAALAVRGINQMFTHQAQAVDAVTAGKNVVVSTSTASGKSLCYNIPILEALVQDRRACALYMFPTKASFPCDKVVIPCTCPGPTDLSDPA